MEGAFWQDLSPCGKPINESKNGFQFLRVEFPCGKMPKVYRIGVCVCVAGMSVATLNFIFLHHVTTCSGTSQWFSQGFPRIILLHVLDHFN